MTAHPTFVSETATADETRALGERLAGVLRAGDVVLLQGDLGAGKTTLTQGIAKGLGIADYVQSPSFILVAEYDGRADDGTPLRLYHLDLYRLEGAGDLESIGFEDYLAPVDGVSVVEWPERASDELPERYILVQLTQTEGDRRRIAVSVVPEEGDLADRVGSLEVSRAAEERGIEIPR